MPTAEPRFWFHSFIHSLLHSLEGTYWELGMAGTIEAVRSWEITFQWGRGYTVKKGWVHVQRRKSCYCGGEDRVEGGAPECRAS